MASLVVCAFVAAFLLVQTPALPTDNFNDTANPPIDNVTGAATQPQEVTAATAPLNESATQTTAEPADNFETTSQPPQFTETASAHTDNTEEISEMTSQQSGVAETTVFPTEEVTYTTTEVTECAETTAEPTESTINSGCLEQRIDVRGKGKLLTSCNEICDLDEVLPEGDNNSCVIVNESLHGSIPRTGLLGSCVDGVCEPNFPEEIVTLEEHANIEDVLATEPHPTLPVPSEEPLPPPCENITFVAMGQEAAVTKCQESCGDSIIIAPDNTTCIHQQQSGVPDVMGICRSGECFIEAENPEQGPVDSCAKHRMTVNNTTVYLQCTFVCEGDEANIIDDGELCVFENASAPYNATVTGICRSGTCQKDEVIIITEGPSPSKPNCTNPNIVFHNKTVAVSECQFLCGDVMQLEVDNTTCVMDMHKKSGGSYQVGSCKEGNCITDAKQISNRTGPPDDCNKHDINTTGDAVFLSCSFLCEIDEMFSLFQKEPCLLRKNDSEAAFTESYEVGMCIQGECIKCNDTTTFNDTTVMDVTTTDYDETTSEGEAIAIV